MRERAFVLVCLLAVILGSALLVAQAQDLGGQPALDFQPVIIQTGVAQTQAAEFFINAGESPAEAAARISRELNCDSRYSISVGEIYALASDALRRDNIGERTKTKAVYPLRGTPICPSSPLQPPGSYTQSASCSADAARLISEARRYLGTEVSSSVCSRLGRAGLGGYTCACFISSMFRDAGYGNYYGYSDGVMQSYRNMQSLGAVEVLSIENLGEQRGSSLYIDPSHSDEVARLIQTLVPGDVLLFKTYDGSPSGSPYTHVGIYVGNDKFIHSGHPIKETTLSRYVQKGRYGIAFRKALRVIPSCVNPAQGTGSSSGTTSGLSGKRIFIDVGHVGAASGLSQGAAGEKALNTAIANLLSRQLQSQGAQTRLLTGSSLTLQDRVEQANAFRADLMISIHHQETGAGLTVTLVYYPGYTGSVLPQCEASVCDSCSVDASRCSSSKNLATAIKNRLKTVVGGTRDLNGNDGLWVDSIRDPTGALEVLYPHMPAALVEVTGSDDARASTSSFQNSVVNAIIQGIADYYGVSASGGSSSGAVS
ncbi:MAG: N-acetylmuramoyl-L-alanine amidase, partial [Candidatus Micrarchaeota archaeon]